MPFVKKISSEAAHEWEGVFKIHHINKAGSSNLKFLLIHVNSLSFCQGGSLRFILC